MIDHLIKDHTWEGKKFDPLNIAMYEISSAALDKTITLNVDFVFAGATGVTELTTIRSTDADLSFR